MWIEPARPSGSLLLTDYGTDSFTFALPAGVAASSTAFIDIPNTGGSPNVTLTWAGGSTSLARADRKALVFLSSSYAVPQSVLRDAVANGGIVNVTLPAGTNSITASLEVWEKQL